MKSASKELPGAGRPHRQFSLEVNLIGAEAPAEDQSGCGVHGQLGGLVTVEVAFDRPITLSLPKRLRNGALRVDEPRPVDLAEVRRGADDLERDREDGPKKPRVVVIQVEKR